MSKSSPIVDINQRIRELEEQQINDVADIKDSIGRFVYQVSPMNLLRTTVKEISSREKRPKLIGGALAVGAGLLIKKIMQRKSSSFLSKLAGSAIQALIATIALGKLKKEKRRLYDK